MAAVGPDKYPLYSETLQKSLAENRNAHIKLLSKCLSNNSCPMTFRLLVEAQHSYRGVKLNQPDGQSIRIKSLNAATVGSLFTLTSHLVRAVVRTAVTPLSIPVCFGKASYYKYDGEAKEEVRRIGHEWVDVGVSALCIPLGLAKTFVPDAFDKNIDAWTDYYVKRIDARTTRDKHVDTRVAAFAANQKATLLAWSQGNPPPNLS
jgi:hypothetical protein